MRQERRRRRLRLAWVALTSLFLAIGFSFKSFFALREVVHEHADWGPTVHYEHMLLILPRTVGRKRVVAPLKSLERPPFPRYSSNSNQSYTEYRAAQLAIADAELDRREERYETMDHLDDRTYPSEDGCYRPTASWQIHPTCNVMHEGVHFERSHFLGAGYYRSSWLIGPQHVVLKSLNLNERRHFDSYAMAQTSTEAIILESTWAASSTIDMYCFCATSVMVQRGTRIANKFMPTKTKYMRQSELAKLQTDDVHPMNNLTAPEKLAASLQMAQSLAELHGNRLGVFVNNDIQFNQWLLDKDGRLRLNDFNMAHILGYHPQRHEYCPFRHSISLLFRAPESMQSGMDADESSDVWALGQIFYSMLTGLMPFYHLEEKYGWKGMEKAGTLGRHPYIDKRYRTRSYIEGRLVTIMTDIWRVDPKDRLSIFEVVEFLEETVEQYEEENPQAQRIAEISLSRLVA